MPEEAGQRKDAVKEEQEVKRANVLGTKLLLVLLLGNHPKVCSVKLDALIGAGLFIPPRDFLCSSF